MDSDAHPITAGPVGDAASDPEVWEGRRGQRSGDRLTPGAWREAAQPRRGRRPGSSAVRGRAGGSTDAWCLRDRAAAGSGRRMPRGAAARDERDARHQRRTQGQTGTCAHTTDTARRGAKVRTRTRDLLPNTARTRDDAHSPCPLPLKRWQVRSRASVAPGRQSRRGHARARSEQALIRGALAGAEEDLEQLFHRFWPRAYRIAFLIAHDHAAAEDIAQEAFVQAIRRLDRFDRRRRFAPWLGAIVANRAIDWTRARAARRESEHAPPEPVAPPDAPTRPLLRGGDGGAGHPDARSTAPSSCSAIVLEYTPGEIARALDLPAGDRQLPPAPRAGCAQGAAWPRRIRDE